MIWFFESGEKRYRSEEIMRKKDGQRLLQTEQLSRRRFLEGSLSLAALAGTGMSEEKKLWDTGSSPGVRQPKVSAFRTLGRTGFQCSDIGLGSGELAESALLEAILDAGINYIDTAENYRRGGSERVIGSVISKGDRKKLFISTKLGLRGDLSKAALKTRALKCLERLRTDYVDCLMIHSPSRVEDLGTEGFHAALKELKAEGRVRYCGLSNHGAQWNDVPETMQTVHLAAAEDGRFDVALLVYNFLQRDQGEKILQAYKKHNVGATIMKTNPVLNYLEMKEEFDRTQAEGREPSGYIKRILPRLKVRAEESEAFKRRYDLVGFDEVRNAAIKFVLNNPNVSCACPTIKNFKDLEVYTALSGQRFDLKAKKMLSDYEKVCGEFYCRHACGTCEPVCPHGVPVNTILRYHHYFRAQGREKSAMTKYAALTSAKADLCRECSGICEAACPYGVPIQGLLVLAHETLTFV